MLELSCFKKLQMGIYAMLFVIFSKEYLMLLYISNYYPCFGSRTKKKN